ncbi:hypothetical protein UZ36_02235 [Candidatus Nitromaritima sp. SCGC AAA799-C22]|nr:hypothetical protein UZ36_02235 [Candidatus Nitromaritima sp. SCGC AAA799-C22]
MDKIMSCNLKLKWFHLAPILVLISGCGTTAPLIKYSNPSQVTIGHTNMGLRPTLTREVRDLAEKYCKKQGKYAEYTGILRDSGWGPEEFDFRCVNYSEPQQAQAIKKPSALQEQPPQSGTGSGFFVSKMGHVITNAHVVKNRNRVTIGDNANKQVSVEML